MKTNSEKQFVEQGYLVMKSALLEADLAPLIAVVSEVFEEITFAHWVKSTGRESQWRVFFNVNGWKDGDIHYQLAPNNKVEFSIKGNPGGNDSFANYMVAGGEMDKKDMQQMDC